MDVYSHQPQPISIKIRTMTVYGYDNGKPSITLETLTEEVDRLHALLHDAQPGLMSWNMLLANHMKSLVNIAEFMGIRQ